jgi:hypothetical protein
MTCLQPRLGPDLVAVHVVEGRIIERMLVAGQIEGQPEDLGLRGYDDAREGALAPQDARGQSEGGNGRP